MVKRVSGSGFHNTHFPGCHQDLCGCTAASYPNSAPYRLARTLGKFEDWDEVPGDRTRPYFYRTAAGTAADLILEITAQRRWAFEIKLSSAPKVDRGFHTAADDLAVERRILVHRGNESFPMRGGIEAMPLMAALNAVRAG